MKSLTVSQIQQTVCDYYRIPVDATQTNSRKRELVQARQVTMYFSRLMTKESLREIGLLIAGKDHATVLHACKTVNNLIDTDKDYKYDIYKIERELSRMKGTDAEPVMDIEIADLHDFFPHSSSYPEIEFTIVKLFRPKLWAMKFKVFKTKVVNVSEHIFKPSPYMCLEKGYYRREFSGYRVHAL